MAAAPIACLHCGATFTPKRSTARFCRTACRVAAHRLAPVAAAADVMPDGAMAVREQDPEPPPFSWDLFGSFDDDNGLLRVQALYGSGIVEAAVNRLGEVGQVLRWGKANIPPQLYPGWLTECGLTPSQADLLIVLTEGAPADLH
jgi:hypothetical protein